MVKLLVVCNGLFVGDSSLYIMVICLFVIVNGVFWEYNFGILIDSIIFLLLW